MSVKIDITKCTGCGTCTGVCPQNAIRVRDSLAVVNEDLCLDCGRCAPVCPSGAIREAAPALVADMKGGDRMFYGYGRGGGSGRGFGFRGSSPPWPYVGRGRGGMPRCWHPGLYGGGGAYMASGIADFPPSPAPAREDELGVLKEQAAAVKEQLDWINTRIHDLENRE